MAKGTVKTVPKEISYITTALHRLHTKRGFFIIYIY